MKGENMKVKGWFVIDHYDKDGNLIEQVCSPNVITNNGKAEVAGLIVSDVSGVTAFDYIAIGTGTTTPSATNTSLVSEITSGGGARAAVTGSRVTTSVTNDTAQFQVTFNFTSSFAVTESGVFNASSGGKMLCRQTFSAINVSNGDSLQVTWKVQVS